MITTGAILSLIKHVAAAILFVGIVLTPAYLAAANGRSKFEHMRVRSGSWLFGWSFVGWLFALFVASKK